MATTGVSSERAIAFGGVTPVLRVADVEASTDYYVRALGLSINFKAQGFVSVGRGRCNLFLCEGDQGHPGSWVWIDGVDVDRLYEEFKASGAKIRNPPTKYSWALEIRVENPDGNVLRFGSDPRKNEPEGPWFDMYGDRWIRLPDGSHQKLKAENV